MGSSTGTNNVVVGKDAAIGMTSGDENVFAGYQSGYSATTSDENTALGYQSLYTNTLSSYNVALGHKALYTLNRSDAGGQNTAVGNAAGRDMTDGRYNACYGSAAGRAVTSGEQNTIIGAFAAAGSSAVTGDLNTFIGYGAGKDSTTSGSNNTIIGCDAEASSATVSNEVTIGDTNVTRFRVPGIGLDITSASAVLSGGSPYTELLLQTSSGVHQGRLQGWASGATREIGIAHPNTTSWFVRYDKNTTSGAVAEYHWQNILPASNNNYDLGNTSNRWRNIYTNDLNLSLIHI